MEGWTVTSSVGYWSYYRAARANKTATGSLQKKLDADKKKTNKTHLQDSSAMNLAHRMVDRQNEAAQHR
ncbi:hypothetical protein OPT61_g3149 [Boeremia exigua]|uniref:Uncharacterized protein n=1 Tax=Boeremia exigua TaxID=749465 RepID=A0ACC2IJ34_9PLEO|nr:hypothetical protein OPT61_g3149 [Boeremia exigua]